MAGLWTPSGPSRFAGGSYNKAFGFPFPDVMELVYPLFMPPSRLPPHSPVRSGSARAQSQAQSRARAVGQTRAPSGCTCLPQKSSRHMAEVPSW